MQGEEAEGTKAEGTEAGVPSTLQVLKRAARVLKREAGSLKRAAGFIPAFCVEAPEMQDPSLA